MTSKTWKPRRSDNLPTRRPSCRLSLEALEDRLVPTTSLSSGDVLVASSASTFNNTQPQPTTEAGLIRVEHNNFGDTASNELAILGDRTGFMSMPDYIVPDLASGQNAGFFVADHTVFGRGAGGIIDVKPPTQSAPDNETAIASQTTYLGVTALPHMHNALAL